MKNSVLLLIICWLGSDLVDCQSQELEPLPDYYAVLGVKPDSTLAHIKKTFRKLALKHHPDRFPDQQETFKALSEAYAVIGDETNRREYDEMLTEDEVLGNFEAASNSQPTGPSDANVAADLAKSDKDVPVTFADPNQFPGPAELPTQEAGQPTFEDNRAQPGAEEYGDNQFETPAGSVITDDNFDVDDETLLKVLKYLSDNDFILTKKSDIRPILSHTCSQSVSNLDTNSATFRPIENYRWKSTPSSEDDIWRSASGDEDEYGFGTSKGGWRLTSWEEEPWSTNIWNEDISHMAWIK